MIPKVSIIITAHNRESYIGKAIESVLSQTYEDFDLLIWDDGSTDRTFAIACDYAKKDNRIRIAAYDHRGPIRALNAAIADTFGPYIGWLDSNNFIEHTTLEKTVAILDSENGVGLVYTEGSAVNDPVIRADGWLSRKPDKKDGQLLDLVAFHFFLMRRRFFIQVDGINKTNRTDQRSER